MIRDSPVPDGNVAQSPVSSSTSAPYAFPMRRSSERKKNKQNDAAAVMRLVDVALRAAPIMPLSVFEQNSATAAHYERRRKQSRAHAHAARLTPLIVVLDAATNAPLPPPPPARICNKWDHFAALYTSRDALCDTYDDPDADALLYNIRRSAQRPSPWWHAALVDLTPAPLSHCPALWYPLLSTSYGQQSLWARAAYASYHSHVVDAPRTHTGQALRAQMRSSELLSSFHQALLEKVQFEVATAYRTDMVLALLFLVMEAFGGEVLPPVYIAHMAIEALRTALRSAGGGDCLRLEALVPAECFHEAAFAYLDRWVETAFVTEWRDMLSHLLHVVTPAIPVALRLVVEAFLPLPSAAHSDVALWEWRLPFVAPAAAAGGRRGKGPWWWVPYPPETCSALERRAVARCTSNRPDNADVGEGENDAEGAPDVIDADHFEEVVQWHGMWDGVVVRHEGMPMLMRRRLRPDTTVPPAAIGHSARDGVAALPDETHDDAGTVGQQAVENDHCQRLVALALRTYRVPPPPSHAVCDEGPTHTVAVVDGESDGRDVDWGTDGVVDALAEVDAAHWARRLAQYPLPTTHDAQQCVFDALVRDGGVALPPHPVAIAAYGPPFRPYQHSSAGSDRSATGAGDPQPDGSGIYNPKSTDAVVVPQHVVSGMVAPAGASSCALSSGPHRLKPLPRDVAAELRWLKERALWKPQGDDVVLHYFDGYCTAKALIGLPALLRLLHDAPSSTQQDAIVLFGQLQRQGATSKHHANPKLGALMAVGNRSSMGDEASLEALNIQLLHQPTEAASGRQQHAPMDRSGTQSTARRRRMGCESTNTIDDEDTNGDASCPDDDGHFDGLHPPSAAASADAFTFDVFLAAHHRRVDHLLRAPLITSGGVAVLHWLIRAIRQHVVAQDRATRAAAAHDACSPGLSDAFVQSAASVASARHVRLVLQCASQDGWAQPLGNGDREGEPHAAATIDADLSMSAALMLELQRINPRCRVQLPLGGLRTRPHKAEPGGSSHTAALGATPQAGRPPASISFPDETPLAALASMFHKRVSMARRNRTFHFNAVRSPAPSPRSSIPPSSTVGSPTASVDAHTPYTFGPPSQDHQAKRRLSTKVPLTVMSATKVFQPASLPPPMGLGTLIHGRGSLVLMEDAVSHDAAPLDALAAPSASLLQPTDVSLRLRRASVPSAELSQHLFAGRKAMRCSPEYTGIELQPSSRRASPLPARSASSMSYFLEKHNDTGGATKHPSRIPTKGRVLHRGRSDHTTNTNTSSWCPGEDLASGREASWSPLPPLRTVVQPPAPGDAALPGGAASVLPLMKPKKRF